MALDVIKEVGPGGHFLTEDHTLRHFRGALFRPFLSNREAYAQWETKGRQSIHQKATEAAERILREHQPPPLPQGVERELWDVVRVAESRGE
jgi:trimethylamine--corrinoid protein Co-methyltransferase